MGGMNLFWWGCGKLWLWLWLDGYDNVKSFERRGARSLLVMVKKI